MMNRCAAVLCLCFLNALAPCAAFGGERFPSPEFDSGYTIPEPSRPSPPATLWSYVDVGVLLLALTLSTILVLHRRRRREIFTLMVFSLLYFGFYRRGCVCAVGSIQNVALSLFDHAHAVPLMVLAFFLLPLLFTLLFGRTFCAAVCPLGAIQDVFVLRPVRLPAWLAETLGMLPLVYLGSAVLFAALGAGFIICRYDPFVSIFRLSGSLPILIFGAVLLATGMFVARPYCRFLCPFGVLLGWMSRLSWRHATITPDDCIQCRLCEEACPFGAILKPSGEPDGRRPVRGMRRLAILLLLLPVMIAALGWIGAALGPLLSRVHPVVSVAEQVAFEESGKTGGTTLESETFRSTGKTPADLFREASGIRERFILGGMLLGAFLGLAFGLKLIALSTRGTRADFEPDRGLCMSCGRCFSYCPRGRRTDEEKSEP